MEKESRRFRDRAKRAHGLELAIESVPESAATADVATALGCEPAQIARSLVFVADELLVVVTSGGTDVDTRKLATLRGVHTARVADPGEVAEALGYEAGGLPPFCHDRAVPVYLDETLAEFETVWATAGSPTAFFPIAPDRLVDAADAAVVDIVD